jgi:creatinine amidohydrolase
VAARWTAPGRGGKEANVKARTTYDYNKLTWPEMNDAIEMQKVVLLPTGSTEQHGAHLPLDTDLFLVESVCQELGRRAPDKVLVLPAIPYGLNMHHFDFPGTLHVEPQHFIDFCVDVLKGVAYHGFKRMAVVNGHGSNMPMADLIARRIVLETPSLCCAFGYYNMGREETLDLLGPGVYAHADEWETSLYLHFARERVQMDKAVEDGDRVGKTMTSDSTTNVRFNDFWGRWTRTGVHGNPLRATPEKGKQILEFVMKEMLVWLDEFRTWPVEARQDQHRLPVQRDIRW